MSIFRIQTKGEILSVHQLLQGSLSFPCAGNHTCGKCKIKISGNVLPPEEEELKFLTQKELQSGIRLACFVRVKGKAVVETIEQKHSIAAYQDEIPVLTPGKGAICAVDIGTTTVVVALYSAETGKLLSQEMEPNEQKAYGADVISRIESCKKLGVEVLSRAIREQVESMYQKALSRTNAETVSKMVVTGNTTMLHIFEGFSPESIGVYPFDTVSLFGTVSEFHGAYLPRCVGAYVGADVMCSVTASGMLSHEENSILADMGTNGEMALYRDGKLTCCSTAAGPAFEGAGLSCGSAAVDGAVSAARLRDGKLELAVIGGGEPKSICGSGVISLISLFKDSEIIDETGRFTEIPCEHIGRLENGCFILKDTSIGLSQQDIRQIQLAKSAICAGILTLSKETDTPLADIQKLYIAGGFGAHINIDEAVNIGLIPKEFREKCVVLGNAALGGAAEIALGYDEPGQIYSEFSLSASPTFMDYYVDCMMF